jgi:hypothetical protein
MWERGWGSQFQRGDRHCGTLGIFVLCGWALRFLLFETEKSNVILIDPHFDSERTIDLLKV